nr:MAG TPA: hypothetical protein [Caudoviricetes sp.]
MNYLVLDLEFLMTYWIVFLLLILWPYIND